MLAGRVPAQVTGEETPIAEPPAPAEGGRQYSLCALEGTLDPSEYVIGAGDVLLIGFWGDVNRQEMVTVSPDGDILITPVGPVRVNGLTLSEVREAVKQQLAAYYRPNILSVSLVSIRTFQVHVVGMVLNAGAVEVNAVTRVSQAIGLAGGFIQRSSRRNIQLRRNGRIIGVDLGRYFGLGDNTGNPFLEGGDVVYVPPVAAWVEVYGSVHGPGRYELHEGDTAGDIIELAGGLLPEAYLDSVEIQRFSQDGPDASESVFIEGACSVLDRLLMMPGDRIFVRAIPGWHRDAKVEVLGEVKYPGVYVVDEGVETLLQLLERAGGLTEMASLAEARLIRGAYADTEFPIEVELTETRDLEVSFDEKDFDLLKTLSREPKGALSLSFEKVLVGGDGGKDPPLYDGDIIEIPRAVWYVRVAGHVRNPGLVVFRAGEGHDYYVKQAGGFAPGADRRGTKLIKGPTGQRIKPGGEDIRPGDIIWIPRRPDPDWWKITRDVLQVLAQAATIYVVADEVSSR
jgi:protein involved in polysaccharide export with SLBB domain